MEMGLGKLSEAVAWLGTNLDGESEPFLTERQAEFWSNGACHAEPLVPAHLLIELKHQVQKLTAENERLRKAMEPFAKVAEHDIGEDEDDADIFWPISNARYSMAGRLRVGHLRAARSALETQEDGE